MYIYEICVINGKIFLIQHSIKLSLGCLTARYLLTETHRLHQPTTYRGLNKVFKMRDHDGQPIPELVSHLLHLLGHTTECRPIAITSLAQSLYALRVGCTRKPQTNSIYNVSLTTGTRAHLHYEL